MAIDIYLEQREGSFDDSLVRILKEAEKEGVLIQKHIWSSGVRPEFRAYIDRYEVSSIEEGKIILGALWEEVGKTRVVETIVLDEEAERKEENFETYSFILSALNFYFAPRKQGVLNFAGSVYNFEDEVEEDKTNPIFRIPTTKDLSGKKRSVKDFLGEEFPLTRYGHDVIKEVYTKILNLILKGFYLDGEAYIGSYPEISEQVVNDIVKKVAPKGFNAIGPALMSIVQ